MKLWLKYGLLNAILGLCLGLIVNYLATGDDYQVFIIVGSLAFFLCSSFLWKILIMDQNQSNLEKVLLTGFFTGTVSHYFTFLLHGLYLNMCYWVTGGSGCLDSFGEPPPSVVDFLWLSIGLSFISLLTFGWITLPASIAIGLLLRR